MATNDIVLRSGRSISLQRLDQHLTYAGLLVGHPTAQMNRELLAKLTTTPRDDLPIHLIPPRETPRPDWPPSRLGDPAMLPAVVCRAEFESSPIDHVKQDRSWLAVVWLQDEFAFPIDPAVAEALAGLDWERLAQDYQW